MTIYKVQGKWPFPQDMLRYDGAAPIHEDLGLLQRLSAEFAESRDFMAQVHTVTLTSARSKFSIAFGSSRRWESFGWRVIEIEGEAIGQPQPPEAEDQKLERVARALCEARGVEPDSMQAYDNGTTAYTCTHAWRLAAGELKAAKLLAEHVEMLK